MHLSWLIVFVFWFCGFVEGENEQNEQGMCAQYRGKICKNYIGTRQVWFPLSGGLVNENITKGLWEEMISGLKEPCQSAAKVKHIRSSWLVVNNP